jgi:hypothetical protein
VNALRSSTGMPFYHRWFAVLVLALFVLSTLGVVLVPQLVLTDNPIVRENRNYGTTEWQSPNFASYGRSFEALAEAERAYKQSGADKGGGMPQIAAWQSGATIEGYAGRTSINKGEPITLHVSTSAPQFDVRIYRQGWYGGSGSSLKYESLGLPGTSHPVPAPDANGMVAANWPAALTIQTDASWTSGVYLVWLSPTGNSSIVKYAIFVVRDDAQIADILYPVPTTNYQAYNAWGGKSLYDYNSPGGRASKVSYDRPYDHNDGSGLFFPGDYNMIRWLEKEGYNVTYATSEDIQVNPNLMNGRKVFLSNFHDEYWSMTMLDNLTAWRDAGKDLAFFDSNNIYWQIRYEANSAGVPNRVIVCYKDVAADPMSRSGTPELTTTLFRNPPVNKPENFILGTMFDNQFGYGEHQPWVVSNASHWIYAGTGLQNGDTIDKLVGYEFDRVYPDSSSTPAGLEVIATSPINFPQLEVVSVSHAAIYTAPSGAMVFNAGTNYWPFFLLGNWIWPEDARVQQMTRNILNRMISGSGTPGPTYTPTSTPTRTLTPSATPTPDPNGGTFFRGINLGGPAVTVDGNTWQASTSTLYASNGTPQSNQWLTLSPAATGGKATMLTSWVSHWAHDLALNSVPDGSYDVYVYVMQSWDDPGAQPFTFAIEGVQAGGWTPAVGGSWTKLGPFRRTIADGNINITTGGNANFAGVEVWTTSGGSAPTATMTSTATAFPATNTPTSPSTPSSTPLPTNTSTSTATRTPTPSNTPPATSTPSNTATRTLTPSSIPLGTNTPTRTATRTLTPTRTATATRTPTRTSTPRTTSTPTRTATRTSTPTHTATSTSTPLATSTPTRTATSTPAPTNTPSSGSSTFYRAIDVNGLAITLDGNAWTANNGAANFTMNGSALSNEWLDLSPSTDAVRAAMLTTWRQHWAFDIAMSNVPNGTYEVYIYVVSDWTNPDPPTATFQLEGEPKGTYTQGAGGTWQKLGPYTATVTDGTLNITAGGLVNISGLEVWRTN